MNARPLLLLSGILLTHALIGVWSTARNEEGVDFYQFWLAPQVVSRSESPDLYNEDERKILAARYLEKARRLPPGEQWRFQGAASRRAALETAGTPFLYAAFAPWFGGDYERDYRRYQFVCGVLGLVAMLVLARLLGYPGVIGCLVAAVFIDWFEPFRSEVRVANVNRLLLAGITAYLLVRARPVSRRASMGGGAILGLLVAFKPIVGVLVVLAPITKAMRGRLREAGHEIAGAGLGAIAAILVSTAFFGDGRAWFRWMDQLGRLPDSQITVSLGNYALAMVIRERWGWSVAPWLLALLTGLVLTSVLLARPPGGAATPPAGPKDEFILEARMVSLGLLVYLLGARLAWLHYFVLTIPAILVAARPEAWRLGSPRSRTLRLALLWAATLLVALNPSMDLFVIRDPVVWALLVESGAALLFALTLADLVNERRRSG